MKLRLVSVVTISLCLIQAVSVHGQTEPGQNQLQPSGDPPWWATISRPVVGKEPFVGFYP